jgi:hypothetical protein
VTTSSRSDFGSNVVRFVPEAGSLSARPSAFSFFDKRVQRVAASPKDGQTVWVPAAGKHQREFSYKLALTNELALAN